MHTVRTVKLLYYINAWNVIYAKVSCDLQAAMRNNIDQLIAILNHYTLQRVFTLLYPIPGIYTCTGTQITRFTIIHDPTAGLDVIQSVQFTYLVNGAEINGAEINGTSHGGTDGSAETVTMKYEP